MQCLKQLGYNVPYSSLISCNWLSHQRRGEEAAPQPEQLRHDGPDEAVDDQELPLAGIRKLESLFLSHVKNYDA